MLPENSAIRLSVVNTKLRDFYPSLEALCEDMEEDKEALVQSLERAGYRYDAERNQFV